MLKNLLIAAIALAPLSASALSWTLQSKVYQVDTLFHAKIGPGTTQTSLKLSGAQNLRVFYTTTDLTDPNVDIRVTKGGGQYKGCQTLSAQQKAADREGARYFAGVNADFFGNSAPIGSTVVDGQVINTAGGWVNWYMTKDKKPGIAALGYNGTATFPGGATHGVNGINCGRGENQLIVYNKKYNGSNSGTNQYGWEVAITPVSGDLGFSGKSTYRVSSAPASEGSMAIPSDGYVLSGHGDAAALVNALSVGQEVTLDLYPSMAGTEIWQMASGTPIILKDGKTLDTQGALDHLTALNPRTAVGYNADGTKLVLMVVDGRTGTSAGVVSRVLADLMREVGCSDAMNFDGGGSSEMYTSTFGVRNHPSDGSERPVTNAVWCVSTSPDDNTVASIAFPAETMTLPKYGFYTPEIYAYNKYGVLIDTNLKGVTLSCDPTFGTIVDDGATFFANGEGYQALTATYGGISCSIPVLIGSGEPHARLSSVLVDSYKDYKTEVLSAVNDLEMPIDNSALEWTSDNSAVATVSDAGLIHGVSDGTATVTGTVDSYTVSLPVTVQIPTKRWAAADPARDLSKWTVTRSGVANTAKLTKIDDEAFDIFYTVSGRSPQVGVKMNTVLAGCPDSLRIAVDPGEASITKISIAASSAAYAQRTHTQEFTPEKGKTTVLTIPMNVFTYTPDDFMNYPYTLGSIKFFVSEAKNESRTIHVKALQAVHTALPMGFDAVEIITPDETVDPDAPVIYYTLDGVQLSGDPAPGLYIRRQGRHAAKVLVR